MRLSIFNVNKNVELAWQEQIKREHCGCEAILEALTLYYWCACFVFLSFLRNILQKLQITKITAPAAHSLDLSAYVHTTESVSDSFYLAHVSLCSVCWLEYESDCNINHLLIAFYHRWKLLRFFPLPFLH